MTVRIFYAEDNKGDVRLVREALNLEQMDYVLDVATDGDKALAFLLQIGGAIPLPHVILLDLNLPKVTGHDLLEVIRHRKESAGVPVFIFTSSDAAKDRERAAALGATGYFVKPADFEGFAALAGAVRQAVPSEYLDREVREIH